MVSEYNGRVPHLYDRESAVSNAVLLYASRNVNDSTDRARLRESDFERDLDYFHLPLIASFTSVDGQAH